MYPFMTLPDDTEIVHSQTLLINGKEQVKIYMEKPIHMGFNTATCYLPDYKWEGIHGFTEEEMDYLRDIIQSTSHLIIQFAREGGAVSNASDL